MAAKGRPMPSSKTRTFTNAYDNQTVVTCNIYEGEEKYAKNNTFLGSVDVPIPAGPKNTVEVLVRAKMSKDGVLSVNVIAAGDSKSLKIERQYGEDNSGWTDSLTIGEGSSVDKEVKSW